MAVGNFDGVHLGHAHLLQTLRKQARPAVVLSFDPHPLQLLAPERFQPLLNTPEDRVANLLETGADHVVLLRTTTELLRLTPEEFFERIVQRGFAPKAMVEGFNFRFGRDRAGDTNLLERLCRQAGIAFTLVPPFELESVPVSSSRVRTALLNRDVVEAARLMGRRNRISGVVGTGQRRGRTLGFPTANLEHVSTLIPGDGVYAVRVDLDGKPWSAAANVGPNPTFGENVRKIEVHLIDFAGDLYGKTLSVTFLQCLRGTRSFSGPNELIEQLRRDVDQARSIGAEASK